MCSNDHENAFNWIVKTKHINLNVKYKQNMWISISYTVVPKAFFISQIYLQEDEKVLYRIMAWLEDEWKKLRSVYIRPRKLDGKKDVK